MLERVRKALIQHRMLAPGDLVLVGVSGGPDSVALVQALHILAPQRGFTLHIFHLNHCLRGSDSYEDARWVAAFAQRLGLPCTVREVNVAAVAQAYGGTEAAGRAVRYQELGRLAAALGAQRIAVGHNQDDQAETLLLRLFRGAGRRGLAGMAPVRPAGPPAPPGTTVVRPLLSVARADIENFCRDHGLTPRFDKTNAEPTYLRNRVRIELMPFLRQHFNPSITRRLAETAALLHDEDNFLDEAARAVCTRHGMNPHRISAEALLAEHPALRRRIIRLLAGRVGVTLDMAAVEAILHCAGTSGRAAVSLPGGGRVLSENGWLHFQVCSDREEAPGAVVPDPLPLPVPGEVIALGWRFTALPRSHASDNPLQLVLDPDRLPGPLAVRTWRPGDRIYPTGMRGSKKLQDLFVDAKIPRQQRNQIPLLVTGDVVIWVVGLRADRRFLMGSSQSGVLVTARPIGHDPGTANLP